MSRPGVPATIRPARSDDIGPLVALHRQCFPDYQSTRLGATFCRRLFETYLSRSDVAVNVAVDDTQQIQGYFVGATAETQRAVTRSLTRWAALASVGQLVRSPREIARIVDRGRRLLRARHTARDSTQRETASPTTAPSPSAEPGWFRLVLIAVGTSAQGTGVSDALLDRFAEVAWSRGFEFADLVVEENNGAAQRCYLRNGWTLVARDPGDPSMRYQLRGAPT